MKTDVDLSTASTNELSSLQNAELRKLWLHAVQVDTHAIGFLPTKVFEFRSQSNEVFTVHRNKDLVGWCLTGISQARNVLKCYQIWVRPDARILEHGRALIARLQQHARQHRCWMIEAWVAEDLPANLFWNAIGFERTNWRHGRGKSCRRVWRWTMLTDVV